MIWQHQWKNTLQEVGVSMMQSWNIIDKKVRQRRCSWSESHQQILYRPPYTPSNGSGSLIFIDDVSSRMNSGVCGGILSTHIQPNSLQNNPLCFFFKAKMWRILQSQSPDVNPATFHLLKAKLKAEWLKNMQELKTVAVKTWQSINREESQSLVMISEFQPLSYYFISQTRNQWWCFSLNNLSLSSTCITWTTG